MHVVLVMDWWTGRSKKQSGSLISLPARGVPQSHVMCAEDARSELPRILHDAGFVLFSLNALKLGRSEEVAYNWSVLTYTSCAGLALGKAVIPLCHRWVDARTRLPRPHLPLRGRKGFICKGTQGLIFCADSGAHKSFRRQLPIRRLQNRTVQKMQDQTATALLQTSSPGWHASGSCS